YVDVTAPWELAKKETSRKHLEVVIYNLLEGLRIIAGLIWPVMPDTASTMQKHLGLETETSSFTLRRLRSWRQLPPGTKIPKGVSLFPRVDAKKSASDDSGAAAPGDDAAAFKPQIGIDDLAKVDLRVATVVRAEAIPRAKKLLKLEIDLGEIRTVVAGIADAYAPEDLVGKQVVVVANLAPAKLMGVLSNGMILAAAEDSGPRLVTIDRAVKPGTTVR
ncbi:MAG: methionine--tRNA ligase subunit beta, partial [Desulfobacterales bacterium]|nr:methionine--tRNA ligase subunit beta [Desulfobacterales bacterium]